MRLLLLLAFTGSFSGLAPDTDAPSSRPTIALPVPQRPPQRRERRRRQGPNADIEWTNSTGTNGCFFFSGPGQYGRDDHLGERAQWTESGSTVTLDFGNGVVFAGQRSGDTFALRRTSSHTFGSTWTTDEMLMLTASGHDDFNGSYSYAECDTADPATCPGHCVITSHVHVHVRR